MASMYEITSTASYLQNMLEEGEIDEQTYRDSIESLMVEDKAEDVCKVIRNLEAKAAACKEEIARLQAKKNAATNGADRLREALLGMLKASGKKKVEAGTFTIRQSLTHPVKIVDETQIPAAYLKFAVSVDKKGIADAIKAGVEVPGAVLDDKEGLQIK